MNKATVLKLVSSWADAAIRKDLLGPADAKKAGIVMAALGQMIEESGGALRKDWVVCWEDSQGSPTPCIRPMNVRALSMTSIENREAVAKKAMALLDG